MSEVILSDYFYGDESEQFIYFRIPRLLITSPRFKHLSTDAKLLYGMLLDRMSLSAKNNWYDEDGRVYIYYTVEEICGDMNCGRDKAMKLLAELDAGKGVGLIERIKQGQGKPTKIYVKRFTTRAVPPPAPPESDPFMPIPEVDFSDVQKSEKPTSRGRKSRLAEVEKSDPNHTNRSHPDFSHPDPSISPRYAPGEVTPEEAHAAGVEFARRLLGNSYEAVISTHLDREHLHCHIVFNSVSFVDGRKYRSDFQSYFGTLRETSNAVSRDHGLSVIEETTGQGKHYAEWEAERTGKETVRGLIRRDIDAAIRESFTFESFLTALRRQGYSIKYGPNVKHTAICPPGGQRFFRLSGMGERYTEAATPAFGIQSSQPIWRRNAQKESTTTSRSRMLPRN